MKLLFHLGHPAHFHLFKNVIIALKKKGVEILILVKKKDILEDLLKDAAFDYNNILPEGRKDTLLSIAIGLLKQDIRMFKFCVGSKIDLLIGTSASIAHIGKILNIPSLIIGEDDASVVPFIAKISYPFTTAIVSPDVCNNGRWEYKSIKYKGYHELAYLHPDNFIPKEDFARKYVDLKQRFFLLRFAKLGAHHDFGIKGINNEIAIKLINILNQHGNVYITSERYLGKELEKYRLKINPLDIHHVMAFSTLYIGDSQTMAAEAAVLGIPFIRYNDFVGKIGYLNDLENNYELGYGIKTNETELLFKKVRELLKLKDIKETFQKRREIMLKDKIDVAKYLEDLIFNFKK